MHVINKFTDFLLLNANSLSSVGLYNGKAGISLCIFELAHYLNNETLEEKAFELLQETFALYSKGEAISFEAGLSGIGFVLIYLIQNQMLDADYEELFGEQNHKIISRLQKQKDYSIKDLAFVILLELLANSTNDEVINILIDRILTGAGELLSEKLKIINSIDSSVIKLKVLNDLDSYLKMLVLTKKSPSIELINMYAGLYEKGKVASRFSTGYYLENLVLKEKIYSIAHTIKENSLQNMLPDSLALAKRIDLLYLLNQKNHFYQKQIELLEQDLFDFNKPDYEKNMIRLFWNQGLFAGYSSGIARLLLYWIYRENKQNGLDCSRFKYIFNSISYE